MRLLNRVLWGAAVAVPALASAQYAPTATSSTQIYGRIDLSLNSQKRTGTSQRDSAVSSDVSFLGIRGTEDLGGGLKAYFKMEQGLDASSGTAGSTTQLWNREVFVGLSSDAHGALQLGTAWAPAVWLSGRVDPFGRSQLGASQSIFQGTATRGYSVQFLNSIQYVSPVISNFQGRLYVAAGEGTPSKGTGALLDYRTKDLYVGLMYDRVGVAGATVGLPSLAQTNASTLAIGATYKLPLAKLSIYGQQNRTDGLPNVSGTSLGLTVPVGTGEIRTSYSRVGSGAGAAKLMAVGYHHALSTRTSVYASVGRMDNGARTRFSLSPSAPDFSKNPMALGQDATGIGIGFRHTF